jgi:preprotein translocase subunit SecA
MEQPAAPAAASHVMSVNDYLARRDADWMRPVYQMLGVSSGCIGQDSDRQHREDAYAAQVTYAPVSELGFDVLRDRLREDVAELLVPTPDVVLIDEADFVLIDEALVPLVLAVGCSARWRNNQQRRSGRSPSPSTVRTLPPRA